jgi:leucyl aminopeptidase
MKISVAHKLSKTDALMVFVSEKKFIAKNYVNLLPVEVINEISARIKTDDFKGSQNEVLQVFVKSKSVEKIFLVGYGKDNKNNDLMKAAGTAIRKAKKSKAKKVMFAIPDNVCAHSVTKGAYLGNYEFKLGDTSKQFSPSELKILTTEKITTSDLKPTITLAEAMCFTRDLINMPANLMRPDDVTTWAKKISKGLRNPVKLKVMTKKELTKLKMGGMLAVGQGSSSDTKILVFEYKGGKKSDDTIALVGKGVCYDSGGYSIKPTSGMVDMKMDMGGSATVLGIFHWIAQNKPKKNIIGVVGLVENMISAEAYRPGDIITLMNGQTCRITNTDAEGRLVLADCLHYVCTKYKPAKIIDFATLTGAIIRSIGENITGVFTNEAKFLDELQNAAKTAGEDTWQMPLNQEFRDCIKDQEADILNWTGKVKAGASMAAGFLVNFVGDTPWIHCDIAGTAYHDKGNELQPMGASGAMVSSVVEMLKD